MTRTQAIGDLQAALAVERQLSPLHFALLLEHENKLRALKRQRQLTEAQYASEVITVYRRHIGRTM